MSDNPFDMPATTVQTFDWRREAVSCAFVGEPPPGIELDAAGNMRIHAFDNGTTFSVAQTYEDGSRVVSHWTLTVERQS
jgi:hypothetical protein